MFKFFLCPFGNVHYIHSSCDVRATMTDVHADAFLFFLHRTAPLVAHFTASLPSCLVQRRGIGSPSFFLRGPAGSCVIGTSMPMVASALRALTNSTPTPSSSGSLPKARP